MSPRVDSKRFLSRLKPDPAWPVLLAKSLMRLILHIGTEKTGTTALQDWLALNHGALAAQGVWCCRSLGAPNNRWLALLPLGLDSEDDGFAQFAVASEAAWQAQRADLLRALADELDQARRAGAFLFIISSEHAHSRLTRDEHVARLQGWLAPLFSAVDLVVSFRPVVELAVSKQSTATRAGYPFDFASMRREVTEDAYFDYPALIARWRRAFPAAAWHVSAYRRERDTIAMLIRVMEAVRAGRRSSERDERFADRLTRLPRPHRSNAALDERLVRLVTMLTPPGAPRLPVTHWPLDAWITRTPFTLSRAQATALQVAAGPIIAGTLALCPSLTAADLSIDPAHYPEVTPEPPALAAEDVALLRWLLTALDARAALAEARLALAEANAALLQDDRAKAQTQLATAAAHLKACRAAPAPGLQGPLQTAEADHARLTAALGSPSGHR